MDVSNYKDFFVIIISYLKESLIKKFICIIISQSNSRLIFDATG